MNAYSRLKRLLKQKRLSVPELHRRMRAQGLSVNVKSLYRLSDDSQPVERLDMRVAGAICQVCAVPLSEWIVFEEEAQTLRTLTAQQQNSLDALMTRNNEGLLTDTERAELHALVREAEEITLANARLLAQQQQRLEHEPSGASRAP
jgi:transcriptional regulator with XRE-family HTH domain